MPLLRSPAIHVLHRQRLASAASGEDARSEVSTTTSSSGGDLAHLHSTAAAAASSAVLPRPLPSGKEPLGLHVLVVEDDPVVSRMEVRLLTRMGATCTAVEDGDEVAGALEASVDALVGGSAVDAILMDVVMKRTHGDVATRQLREEGCTLPIIMVTANTSQEDVERYMRCGATAVCAKPFTAASLRQALVEHVLQRGRPAGSAASVAASPAVGSPAGSVIGRGSVGTVASAGSADKTVPVVAALESDKSR
jgi:CheY-like chemotaxis protein